MRKGQVVGTILTTLPVFFLIIGTMGLLLVVAKVVPSQGMVSALSPPGSFESLLTSSVSPSGSTKTLFELLIGEPIGSASAFSPSFLTAWESIVLAHAPAGDSCTLLVYQPAVVSTGTFFEKFGKNRGLYVVVRVREGAVSVVDQGVWLDFLGVNGIPYSKWVEVRDSGDSLGRGDVIRFERAGASHLVYVGRGSCDAW